MRLAAKPHAEREPQLTPSQFRQLEDLLKQGAKAILPAGGRSMAGGAGFDPDTLRAVAALEDPGC